MGINQVHLKWLVFICLIGLNFSAIGQYRNFAVGVIAGTNRFKDNFYMGGISTQYNFKKVFSIYTDVTIEKRKQSEMSEFTKQDSTDFTHYYRGFDSTISERLSIPFLLKMTFGKRLLFVTSIGVNYSMLLRSPWYYHVEYDILYDGDQENPLNEVNTTIATGIDPEINLIYGLGCAYSMNNRFLISVDARGFFPLTSPNDRNQSSSYNKIRLTAGVSYQFNRSKKSTYTFTTYSLKMLESVQ